MKVVNLLAVFFSVILLFSISIPKSQAAVITGRSSTVIEWFPDAD